MMIYHHHHRHHHHHHHHHNNSNNNSSSSSNNNNKSKLISISEDFCASFSGSLDIVSQSERKRTPRSAKMVASNNNCIITSSSSRHHNAAPCMKARKSSIIKHSNDSNSRMTVKKNLKLVYSNKSAFLVTITFTSILLLTCLVNQHVSSLNCYTCSSVDNPGCDESFSGRSNFTDTDCEKQIGKPAKVCRKIVQYLENKKVVIRSCGWIDEHEDKKSMCYKRSGTFALMMESCVCYEDNCNHSTSLVPNQSVSILLASGSMIFYYLFGGGHMIRLLH